MPGNRMAQSTHHRHYQVLLKVLRQARQDAGLTQADVGNRLGNTQTFVSKVERGERRLDVAEFVEWCQALHLAPEAVFDEYLQQRQGIGTKLRSQTAGRRR